MWPVNFAHALHVWYALSFAPTFFSKLGLKAYFVLGLSAALCTYAQDIDAASFFIS